MEWLLRHGQFGVLARLRDPQALGAAMNLARHLDPSRIRMRQFAAQFTVEKAGDRYLDVMSGLIDARSGRRGRIPKRLRLHVRDPHERGVSRTSETFKVRVCPIKP